HRSANPAVRVRQRGAAAAAELPLSRRSVTDLDEFLAAPPPACGRLLIAAVPEGHDAFVLGGLVARGTVRSLLHVCRDDGRMARTAAALTFYYPELEVL